MPNERHAKALESTIAIRVALLRLKDEMLPTDDRRHFLEDLVRHGRRIAEIGQEGLQLLRLNGEDGRVEV